MIQCPYPGLRPFEPEDAELFFGRDEQIEQLLDKLADTRFISVVGLSGCGKSSLVNAGLIPALESGLLPNASFRWQTVRMRPGNQPLHNLAEALQPMLATDSEQAGSDLRFLQASLRRGPLSLIEIFRETPLPKHTNLLLVVDQFEELFRYHHEGGKEETEAFVKLLLASVKQDEIPIYLVTTMRSEFIGECALFYDLPEMMNAGQFLAPRLTRDQQREAIEDPATLFGGTIEPRLANTLLNEMGADPDQLPLLQHCLMRMWFHAQKEPEAETDSNETKQAPTNGVHLSVKEYEAVGGLQDALSRHADEAYNELNENQQRIAEIMFRCLTKGDRRRPISVSEIAKVAQASTDEIEEVTKVFRRPDRCFLRPYDDERSLQQETILDISHESLIRQWKRLSKWTEHETEDAETYQNLEKEANQWNENKRHSDFLQKGAKLALMLDWQKTKCPTSEWSQRYGNNFDIAIIFLEESERAQEEKRKEDIFQQQQQLRQARRRSILAIIGCIVAFILAGWAIWERSIAEQARTDAEQARGEAEEQKEHAIESEDRAQKAQYMAELHRASFQDMVNATFGFLASTEKNEDFLDWTERIFTIEKLIPALHLMIDHSESMTKKEKEFWHRALIVMPKEQKLELLDILGAEAVAKASPVENLKETVVLKTGIIHIKQVLLHNLQGAIIKPPYTAKVGEILRITVELTKPSYQNVKIECTSIRGSVESSQEEIMYNAPDISGKQDLVTIKIFDDEQYELLDQHTIMIEIIP